MDAYKELSERLKELKPSRSIFYQGIVKSVEGLTCTVEIEGLDIPDVRLRASTTELDKELLITPQIGSNVIVASLSGDFLDLAIISIDQADKVILHGGKQGGLVLVNELVSKLNQLERSLGDLKQVFASWVTIPSDGGASLKGAVSSWASQPLTPTQVSDIENPKVQQ